MSAHAASATSPPTTAADKGPTADLISAFALEMPSKRQRARPYDERRAARVFRRQHPKYDRRHAKNSPCDEPAESHPDAGRDLATASRPCSVLQNNDREGTDPMPRREAVEREAVEDDSARTNSVTVFPADARCPPRLCRRVADAPGRARE